MADQYQNNVSLLLHCDGTNASTSVPDASLYTFSPTCKGTAALSTVQKQFGSASLKTGNANGNYLLVPPSAAFNFGSGDFTVEAFVWPVSQGADGGAIIGRWDGAGSGTDWLIQRGANGEVQVYANGVQLIAGAAGDLPTGAFAHVALTRAGNQLQVWVGGVAKGSATLAAGYSINWTAGLGVVLGQSNFTAGATWLEAYYDEVRITKGVARYTAAFTPPAAAFDNPLPDPVLLMHFDTATGLYFKDSSPFGRTLASSPSYPITVNASVQQFGAGCAYFTGNPAYFSLNDSWELNFGARDFTIELWIRPTTVAAGNAYLLKKANNGAFAGFNLYRTGAQLKADFSTNGTSWDQTIAAAGTLVANTTYHVALVRYNGTITLYLNGTAIGSVSFAAALATGSSQPLYIGGDSSTGYYAGYMDELRILNGGAAYTGNFTPPVAPFADAAPQRVTQPKLSRIYSRAIPNFQRRGMPSFAKLRDMVWGGVGTVAGRVTVNNVPAQRRVQLFELASMTRIRAAWSDASGNYSFSGIDPTKSYLVLGRDYSKTYNAVVQDNITAVGGVSARSARQKLRFTAGSTGLSTGYPALIRVGENATPLNPTSNCATLADVVVTAKAFPLLKNGDSDIKFTDTSGNELDFWLEQVIGSVGDRVAYYWVKLPGDLDAGPVDVYLNYGTGVRPTKTSNGAAVFPTLFDDFETVTLNSRWFYNGGGGGLSGTTIWLLGNGSVWYAQSVATFAAGLEALAAYASFGIATSAGTVSSQFGWTSGAGNNAAVAAVENTGDITTQSRLNIGAEATTSTNGRFTPQLNAVSIANSGRLAVARNSDGSVVAKVNDQVVSSRTGASTAAAYLSIHRGAVGGSGSHLLDWAAVRKCIPSGPPVMLPFVEEIL
ncbi:DUF2341 domain-containing protein [Cupriavidus sp. BIC8F]|uniref:DUF2341 domain-containing protein n=1 Tax=Cupriavidus sp. BIC8F TaxID=3079014 RepID=UPI0029166B5F|nr:DUF2341 domain-containing protein [Cupriavidus sp. BIC8F]